MEEFSQEDYQSAAELGISKEALDQQWESLKNGFPSVALLKPATVGDGIIRLSEAEKAEYRKLYLSEAANYDSCKFIPASGAASRMFQPFRDYLNDPSSEKSKELEQKLTDLPFYQDVVTAMQEKGLSSDDPEAFIRFSMDPSGMDYNRLPKGLVSFFHVGDTSQNAFQAHLEEAKALKVDSLHFTVAEEYQEMIMESVNEENVSSSIQNAETDYIAMEGSNAFRKEGQLVFRPSGHGALLVNLNRLKEELFYLLHLKSGGGKWTVIMSWAFPVGPMLPI